MNLSHKYSEDCLCQSCNDVWRQALLKALDRGERKRKAKRKLKKKGD